MCENLNRGKKKKNKRKSKYNGEEIRMHEASDAIEIKLKMCRRNA